MNAERKRSGRNPGLKSTRPSGPCVFCVHRAAPLLVTAWRRMVLRYGFILTLDHYPMPTDPLPPTPFDAVTDPDPPEVRPDRPASAPPGPEEYAAQIKETADKLLRDRAGRGDVK